MNYDTWYRVINLPVLTRYLKRHSSEIIDGMIHGSVLRKWLGKSLIYQLIHEGVVTAHEGEIEPSIETPIETKSKRRARKNDSI